MIGAQKQRIGASGVEYDTELLVVLRLASANLSRVTTAAQQASCNTSLYPAAGTLAELAREVHNRRHVSQLVRRRAH